MQEQHIYGLFCNLFVGLCIELNTTLEYVFVQGEGTKTKQKTKQCKLSKKMNDSRWNKLMCLSSKHLNFFSFFLSRWQAPEFQESQIRLLVFRERDKQLLFDSKAIRKKEDEKDVSNVIVYHMCIDVIFEIIFQIHQGFLTSCPLSIN